MVLGACSICFGILEKIIMKISFFTTYLIAIMFLFTGFAAVQNEITIRPNLNQSKDIDQWTLDGSGKWKIANRELILYKAGVPSGSIRRPSALAILKSKPFTNVIVEAQIKSEVDTSIIHRDLEIVVDYQSPKRFYYVHLAGTTDKVHNGIFLVDNADRRRIDSGKGKPQLKDKAWHHIKVIRNVKTGKIEVYTNDSDEPVLEAVDKTLLSGKAGVGSFDDTGFFKDIVVKGTIK
jgi:hypothetical protein